MVDNAGPFFEVAPAIISTTTEGWQQSKLKQQQCVYVCVCVCVCVCACDGVAHKSFLSQAQLNGGEAHQSPQSVWFMPVTS